MDKIRLMVKRGNKSCQGGKKWYLHGQPVDFFKESEYWPELSDEGKSIFYFFDVPGEWEPGVREILGVDAEGKDTTWRKKQINLDAVGSLLGVSGIGNAKNSAEIMPVYDIGEGLGFDGFFKSNEKIDVVDYRAIAGGATTIGSGAPYANLTALGADLADPMTSDFSGAIISSITENAKVTLDVGLGGNSWELYGNKVHCGQNLAARGVHLNILNDYGVLMYLDNGTVIVRDVRLQNDQAVANNTHAAFYIGNLAAATTVKMKNIYLDGKGKGRSGLRVNDANCTAKIWNLVGWDFEGTGILYVQNCAAASEFENGTTWDGTITGVNASVACAVRNWLSYGCGTDYANIGVATSGYNNGDSDGTCADVNWGGVGSGNQPSLTMANEIETTDDTHRNFQKLLKARRYSDVVGVCAKNGITPGITENKRDIKGDSRPHLGGNVSIGAYEYERKMGCQFAPFRGER